MLTRIVFASLISLVATQFSFAHNVWIDKRQGELQVLFGHGERLEPYDAACVKDAQGFDSKGGVVPVAIVRHNDKATLVPKGNPSVITVIFDAGYRVKTTDGKKKIPRSQAVGKYQVIEAFKNVKCIKGFLAPGRAWSKIVGQHLEIVPQKDPMTIRPGEELPIKVLLEGKPLEGAVIATGGDHASDKKNSLKTDNNGLASVKVETTGLQIISAHHKVSLKGDPDADFLYLFSTMTFDADQGSR